MADRHPLPGVGFEQYIACMNKQWSYVIIGFLAFALWLTAKEVLIALIILSVVGWLVGMAFRHRMGQFDAQDAAEAGLRARADETLRALSEGRWKDWLYGKYQPAVYRDEEP